ncbi:uncharacterized protein LOC18023408 [Eutrema salsugineum]|uniref:uncharacterized protein LOC18023408 n=1 Tax=Eutrema salsugineum TaxID=72664 RepID=UPI000CECEB41|nr:uncharacterized protein LOC18023408 [Eutrema salsugineum]
MEKSVMMSKRDVIVCRGIWYVMVLLSVLGLFISLNLLWPPGGKSSSSSRFLRDGAVSATTFYAVTLLRYLFFTESPSSTNNWYKDFTTVKERIPQLVFAELALLASAMSAPICSSILHDRQVSFVLYLSLFTMSLLTGGIGLIQLSDKLRMEMRHAYLTLFSCCFPLLLCSTEVFGFMFIEILAHNLGWARGSCTSSVSPLPA